MPTIHHYVDRPGYYVKARVSGCFVTFQVSPAGEAEFQNDGLRDGDEIDHGMLNRMIGEGKLYTGKSGVEPADDEVQDFDRPRKLRQGQPKTRIMPCPTDKHEALEEEEEVEQRKGEEEKEEKKKRKRKRKRRRKRKNKEEEAEQQKETEEQKEEEGKGEEEEQEKPPPSPAAKRAEIADLRSAVYRSVWGLGRWIEAESDHGKYRLNVSREGVSEMLFCGIVDGSAINDEMLARLSREGKVTIEEPGKKSDLPAAPTAARKPASDNPPDLSPAPDPRSYDYPTEHSTDRPRRNKLTSPSGSSRATPAQHQDAGSAAMLGCFILLAAALMLGLTLLAWFG